MFANKLKSLAENIIKTDKPTVSNIAAEKHVELYNDEIALKSLLSKNPSNCDVWHALGHIYRQNNQINEATNAYSKAIEIAYRYHPIIHFEHSAICLQRALLLFANDEAESANSDIIHAIFQDHNNQPALIIQANGWSKNIELPKYTSNLMTELACEQEIRRDSSYKHTELLPHQQMHDHAIKLWQKGNTKEAIEELSKLLENKDEYTMAWHHRSLMFLELGDNKNALYDINRAADTANILHLNYHQGAALHHFHRGELHQQIGDIDMALTDLHKAINIDKNVADAHAAIANIRYMQGQLNQAIIAIDKALSINPRNDWQEQHKAWSESLNTG